MNITDMNIADGQVMLSQFHESLFDIERIPFAALALIATMIVGAVTGPFMARAVPLMWVAQDLIFGRIGARLDRTRRKQADLMFRGFLFMVFVLALMLIGIKGAGALQSAVPYIGAWYVEVLALCGLLSCGALWSAALALFKTLDQKEKPSKGAYFTLSRTTLRDLNSTDDFGLTRLSLATIVRQLDKGAVSPVLWYVIGGLPLALITSTLSFMAWRFGKDGFGKGFGVIMLALDKLVGFVPTLLSGVLLSVASLVTPKGNIIRAIQGWSEGKRKAAYEEGGQPVTILAFALNISIGGPVRDLYGSSLQNSWAGPEKASAKTTPDHLRRGLYMVVVAHIYLLAMLGGAYIWGQIL